MASTKPNVCRSSKHQLLKHRDFTSNPVVNVIALLTIVFRRRSTIDRQRKLFRTGVELLAHDSNHEIRNYPTRRTP